MSIIEQNNIIVQLLFRWKNQTTRQILNYKPCRCFFLPVIPSSLCKKWKFKEINGLLILELSAQNRFQVKSGNCGNCLFAIQTKLKPQSLISLGRDLFSMNFCPNTNVKQWLAVYTVRCCMQKSVLTDTLFTALIVHHLPATQLILRCTYLNPCFSCFPILPCIINFQK